VSGYTVKETETSSIDLLFGVHYLGIDVGTGSSDLTWQAMVGVSYAYNFGDLMVMYRHIDYDGGSDDLVEDLSFSGPSFGVRFRFQAAHSFG